MCLVEFFNSEIKGQPRNRKITCTMCNLNNTLNFRFYHEYIGIVNFFYLLTFFLYSLILRGELAVE